MKVSAAATFLSLVAGCVPPASFQIVPVRGGTYGKALFLIVPEVVVGCSVETKTADGKAKPVDCASHYLMSCDASRPGPMCMLVNDLDAPLKAEPTAP